MPRRKKFPRSALARMTDDELSELHRRRRAAKLSLSRFLVETALAPATQPAPEAREARDRALFHLRKANDQLDRLTRAMGRGSDVPRAALDEALCAHVRALQAIRGAYEGGGEG